MQTHNLFSLDSRTIYHKLAQETFQSCPPDTVLPLTPGSVAEMASSTIVGGSTPMTRPLQNRRSTSAPSFRYLAQSSSRFRRVSSYVDVSMNTNCARAR